MSRSLVNGLRSVNPRGYQGGQGWLWWALTKRHLPNMLTYFRHRIANATSDGFNSVIYALRYAARGFLILRELPNANPLLLRQVQPVATATLPLKYRKSQYLCRSQKMRFTWWRHTLNRAPDCRPMGSTSAIYASQQPFWLRSACVDRAQKKLFPHTCHSG
jgi:hypothetical protein